MMNKAIIVGASPDAWIDHKAIIDSNAIIIGVDRGALTLLQQEITPDIALGDFDSITQEEYLLLTNNCPKIMKLKPEKDETDTEVAITHLSSLGITDIDIYGGLGGRVDHTIANIRLVLKFIKKGISISLINETNQLKILTAGAYEFKAKNYPYLSFFAIEENVMGLSLLGVKYPLVSYQLKQDDVRCISNEIIDKRFKISFHQGYLLMINSRDIYKWA